MDTVLIRESFGGAVSQAMDQAAVEMQWGHDDCGLWCANIINSVLGYDPCLHLRGRYSDRTSCYQVIGEGGVETELETIAHKHGWREIPPAEAEAGDIGLTWLRAKSLFAIMICKAPGWFVGRNERGWTAVSIKYIEKAFAVI